ncbi:MAG TPA: hypothetical protein VM285_01960 [Polyangia bacterium]|nr:hypothetical protein [Polyangia bacterium]
MSELLNLQFEFAFQASMIVPKAWELGLRAKLGECLRSNEQAEIHALGKVGRAELCRAIDESWPGLALAISDNVGSGIRRSQHLRALAIDIQLFERSTGSDLDEDAFGRWAYLSLSEPYAELGKWWKARHPKACWGGDFTQPDGGHFSFEWRGVR